MTRLRPTRFLRSAPEWGRSVSRSEPSPTDTDRSKKSSNQMKDVDEMMKAVAAYTGPVRRCRPGQPRGKPVKPLPLTDGRPVDVRRERRQVATDDVAQMLFKHHGEQLPADPRAERKRRRKERYQQARIRGRNAAVRQRRATGS
jgi:hypothetical protein